MTPVIDPSDKEAVQEVVWKLPPHDFHKIYHPTYGDLPLFGTQRLKLIRITKVYKSSPKSIE